LHNVTVAQLNAFAKAEAISAKEMDMYVARTPVRFEFEKMMFDILQAVAHFCFASANLFRPEYGPATTDHDFSRYRFKLRIDH